jgi:hypothetical protein
VLVQQPPLRELLEAFHRELAAMPRFERVNLAADRCFENIWTPSPHDPASVGTSYALTFVCWYLKQTEAHLPLHR